MRLQSADTLRALMVQRDRNGVSLANRAGCSRQFISQLLNGQRTSCSVAKAAGIARCLGVRIDTLFVPHPSTTSGRLISVHHETGQ